jgi:GNAT superfamily N-acetyltransferase
VPAPVPDIRVAGREDIACLQAALSWAIDWRVTAASVDPADRISRTGHDYLLDGWGREGDTAVVALVDGRCLGAAWYRLWTDESHSYGYVDADTPEMGIGVEPAARGAGVGQMLITRLFDEARAHGVAALSLSVEQDNFAFPWYERLGFERHTRTADSWTMVKRLG